MKKISLSAILLIFPILVLGQGLDSAFDNIQKKKKTIERIVFFGNVESYGEELDSLAFQYDQDFEKMLLTLYHTEMSLEEEWDYVVAMDIPLLEIIDIESQEYQIKLVFSRTCNLNSTNETHNLELNFASQKAKDDIFPAFKKLLKVRNSSHIRLHESSQCTLETI